MLNANNIEQEAVKKLSISQKEQESKDFWYLTPRELGTILVSKQTVLDGRKVEYIYSFKDKCIACLMCGRTFPPKNIPPLLFSPDQIDNEKLHVAVFFCPMCILFAQSDNELAKYLIKTVNYYRNFPKEPFKNQYLRFVR